MAKIRRWLPLLAITILVDFRTSLSLPVEEHKKEGHMNLTESSRVASMTIESQERNETNPSDGRKAAPIYKPLASPADLLRPDRFQFYTFNNNGEVVTKQMTDIEIQSLIAAGGGHYPVEIHEPMKTDNMLPGETKVADVVQNVQNVLKGELSKPTTMMVPVPTVPGHATDEWSNILPSILSGDSEVNHPSNGILQVNDEKGTIPGKPMAPESTNMYDMYKPQPAIIVEMEPHVHETPSQILVGSDFSDHHVRPLDMKPHPVKPDMDKDSSLNEVPLQTWSTPTKGQDFHFITTEIVPIQRNNSDSKIKLPTPKPIMETYHRIKNATAEQTLSMYSEIPMIPVSVITADQILTSTQKNKINDKPIFQMLSTISPSAISTIKSGEKINLKPDVSVISETHTTSVKYPGYPEMKVTDESIHTTVPVKMKPTMEQKETTTVYNVPTTTSEVTTESVLLTTFTILPEISTKKNVPQEIANIKEKVTTMSSVHNSVPRVTTEMTSDIITDTTYVNDVTTTKDMTEIIKEVNNERTTTEKTYAVTEQILNKTPMPDIMTDRATTYEPMTTTSSPLMNEMMENGGVLPTDLANSLSSVISQVAETIPSILADTQNFPLSELKSKNVSISNEMFDSTTSKDVTDESSTISEDMNIKFTTMYLPEDTTTEINTFSSVVTEISQTSTPDMVDEIISETTEIPTTTSEIKMDSTSTTPINYSNAPTLPPTISPIVNNSSFTNKSPEKHTEATIIHLDVTGPPADINVPQSVDGNNTSESPLIRIQLADIVSSVNHLIDNAPLKSEISSTVHNITLPPNSFTVSPNIASGLIAGFLSDAVQQEIQVNHQNNYTTDRSTTMSQNQEIKLNDTSSDDMKTEVTNATEPNATSDSIKLEIQRPITHGTVSMQTVTEEISSQAKVETTVNLLDNDIKETTTPINYKTTNEVEESTIQFITTIGPVILSNLNKTKIPETPIVRIDVSPETTSNLPPRIQLTDLPIVQESMHSLINENINKESVNDSKDQIGTNNGGDNINLTTDSTLNTEFNNAVTELSCKDGVNNSSKCQNYVDENKITNAVMQEQITENPSNKDNFTNLEGGTISENVTIDEIYVTEKTDSISDMKTEKPVNEPEKMKKPTNYIQMHLTNESQSTHAQLLEHPLIKNESSVDYNMNNPSNVTKEITSSVMEQQNKEEDITSAVIPIKNYPTKQDSYIKLGEQLSKEQMNNSSSTNITQPQKAEIKQPSATTLKPNFSKIPVNSSTMFHKPPPKPVKVSSTTMEPMKDKKPEQVTEMNKHNEEQKWTLIPQQPTSSLINKNKQKVSDPPISTSTIFPNNDSDEYSHRTGSKPVNLDAVKNSAGLDDSVRNLDQDILFFSNLCNELAFSFWTSANKGLSNSRSLALSPFGMTSMLAMIFLGARGPTSAQMNDILKLDDVATFNPHLVFQNITDAVSLARNQGIANAAFVRLLFADRIKVGKLMPFYKEQAQKFYEGFVAEVNFSTISDQVKRRTNLLVRKQTGGRIKDFVKTNTVPLRSPLASLSANVFQTNCNSSGASSEGRDGEMYFAVSPAVRQRRLVPVPATVWRSGVLAGYEPGIDATAIALGGSEKLVSTIFIIPGQQGFTAPGDTLDRLEQRLMKSAYRDKAWDKLLKVIVPRPALELQVPKFSHRSVVNATAALKRMGLEELFSRHANLKGINGFGHDIHLADVLQMNLFSTCGDENISNGRHHVEIYPGSPIRNNREINVEQEVDAFESIKTTVGVAKNSDYIAKDPRLVKNWSREAEISEKPRLRLDRPFLYFVRHNPTGLILHMGRFNPRLLQ